MADFKHKFTSLTMPGFLNEPSPNLFSCLAPPNVASSTPPAAESKGTLIVDNSKFNLNSFFSNKKFLSFLAFLILIIIIIIGFMSLNKNKNKNPTENKKRPAAYTDDDQPIRGRLAGSPNTDAESNELHKIRADIKLIMARLSMLEIPVTRQ